MKERYWDILRGLAIIAVVAGHATQMFAFYLYSYHLALFFFISGILYNEKKYKDAPWLNVAARLKSSYGKFVAYAAVLAVCHNLFVRLHMYGASTAYFGIAEIKNYMLNTALLVNTDPLYGPTWFVAPLILSSAVFSGIVYWGNRAKKNWITNLIIVLGSAIALWLGKERMEMKASLPYRLDVALFVIPIFTGAYFLKKQVPNFRNGLKKWWFVLGAVCTFIGVVWVYKGQIMVSLVSCDVRITTFFPLAILGILANLCWATALDQTKILGNIVAKCGEYSFEIMAFHFTAFKLMDVVICKIRDIHDAEIISKFTHSFDLPVLYLIVGVALPVIVFTMVKLFIGSMKKWHGSSCFFSGDHIR